MLFLRQKQRESGSSKPLSVAHSRVPFLHTCGLCSHRVCYNGSDVPLVDASWKACLLLLQMLLQMCSVQEFLSLLTGTAEMLSGAMACIA